MLRLSYISPTGGDSRARLYLEPVAPRQDRSDRCTLASRTFLCCCSDPDALPITEEKATSLRPRAATQHAGPLRQMTERLHRVTEFWSKPRRGSAAGARHADRGWVEIGFKTKHCSIRGSSSDSETAAKRPSRSPFDEEGPDVLAASYRHRNWGTVPGVLPHVLSSNVILQVPSSSPYRRWPHRETSTPADPPL